MALTTLSTFAKVTIAGAVAGGVFIGGLTFTGGKDITDIKGNLDSLQGKLTQAVSDNEFLSEQFGNLKGLYSSAVDEANGTISGLKADRAELMEQVTSLQSSLTAKQDELDALKAEGSENSEAIEDARDELQAEIDRLEGELTKANEAIAELAVYAEEADSVEYEAVDREAYNVSEKEVEDAEGLPETAPAPEPTPEDAPETPEQPTEPTPEVDEPKSFISPEATALNATTSAHLGNEENVTKQEKGFLNSYKTIVDITGVTTYKNKAGSEFLAYTVTVENVDILQTPAPAEVSKVIMDSGVYEVYYLDDATGEPLFKVNKNGNLTKI